MEFAGFVTETKSVEIASEALRNNYFRSLNIIANWSVRRLFNAIEIDNQNKEKEYKELFKTRYWSMGAGDLIVLLSGLVDFLHDADEDSKHYENYHICA